MRRIHLRRRYLAALAPIVLSCAFAPAALAASCPTVASPATVAGIAKLRDWNRAIDNFGVRTTGSPNHVRYVDWLERQLDSVPGVEVHSLRYRFHRWLARSASLRVVLTLGPSNRFQEFTPKEKANPSRFHRVTVRVRAAG